MNLMSGNQFGLLGDNEILIGLKPEARLWSQIHQIKKPFSFPISKENRRSLRNKVI